jgi:hypothetical protein
MDFVWPDSLIPAEVEWRLLDFTGRNPNPYGGSIRTVERGQRWQVTLQLTNVGGRSPEGVRRRQLLQALLAAMRGSSNRLWLGDVSNPFRGSFACPELIANGYPVAGVVSPWTASSANITLGADGARGLRTTWVTTGTDQSARHPAVAAANAAAYAFRYTILGGKGNVSEAAVVGLSAGAGDTFLANRSAAGRYVDWFAANGTSLHPSLRSLTSGKLAGDFAFWSGVSLSRCATTNGSASAQTSSLSVLNLPASTAGLALAGDLFEVAGSLYRLIADVDSTASGGAELLFEPALRVTVPTASPVIFRDPMTKFLLAEEPVWSTRPGLITDCALTLIEA